MAVKEGIAFGAATIVPTKMMHPSKQSRRGPVRAVDLNVNATRVLRIFRESRCDVRSRKHAYKALCCFESVELMLSLAQKVDAQQTKQLPIGHVRWFWKGKKAKIMD